MNKSESVTELWRYPEKLIPSDWSVQQLKKVTKKIADRDHTTPKYVSSDIGVPIVSPTNLDSQMRLNLSKLKYITKEAHEKNRKKTDLLPEDIIFSRIGAGLGKSYLLDNSFYNFSILHSFCQIRVDDNVTPQYLLWFLRCDYLQWRLKFGIQSIGVPDLGLGEIGELPILFPNQKIEQQKIAQILTSVDEVIEKTQAQIDKLKDLKTAMMQELLTKGIGHVEFKDSPVGRIPVGWEVVTVGTLADVIDPQPDHRTPAEVENGIPYVGLGDIDKSGIIDFNGARKVSQDAFDKQLKGFNIHEQAFIFGKIGTIGNPSILPKKRFYCLSANIVLITTSNLLNMRYLYQLFMSGVVDAQVAMQTNTTSQPALGIKKVREFLVPLPSDEKEKQILVETLSSVDRKTELVRRKLTLLNSQKKALMQDLLTGKVRVQTAESNSAFAVS